eukprot:SAG31_NODE_42544_length_271_cov_0.598837_1_plen_29_part_10
MLHRLQFLVDPSLIARVSLLLNLCCLASF